MFHSINDTFFHVCVCIQFFSSPHVQKTGLLPYWLYLPCQRVKMLSQGRRVFQKGPYSNKSTPKKPVFFQKSYRKKTHFEPQCPQSAADSLLQPPLRLWTQCISSCQCSRGLCVVSALTD